METHWDMVQLLADQAKCDPEDAWNAYKESDYQLVTALSVRFFLTILQLEIDVRRN